MAFRSFRLPSAYQINQTVIPNKVPAHRKSIQLGAKRENGALYLIQGACVQVDRTKRSPLLNPQNNDPKLKQQNHEIIGGFLGRINFAKFFAVHLIFTKKICLLIQNAAFQIR